MAILLLLSPELKILWTSLLPLIFAVDWKGSFSRASFSFASRAIWYFCPYGFSGMSDTDGVVLLLRFPRDNKDDDVASLSLAEAPDWAKERSAEGDNRVAVDAVEIAECTSFCACPATVPSRPARSSKLFSTLPHRPLSVDVTADPEDED